MAELTELTADGRVDAHDRRRVGGPRARDRRRARRSASAAGRTCASPRGLKALVGFGAPRATRSSTSARTRSSSTSASAPRDGAWRTHRRPRRGDAARRGARRDRPARARSRSARTVDAIAAMADEARRARRRGDRRRRHRRGCASRRNRDGAHRRRARRAAASPSRSSPARRRPGSPTSPRRPASSAGGGVAGRVRHRRRQLAVHVRPTAGRSTSASASNVGAVRLTERFGLDGVVSDEVLAAALAAIAGGPRRARRPPAPDARGRRWAAP